MWRSVTGADLSGVAAAILLAALDGGCTPHGEAEPLLPTSSEVDAGQSSRLSPAPDGGGTLVGPNLASRDGLSDTTDASTRGQPAMGAAPTISQRFAGRDCPCTTENSYGLDGIAPPRPHEARGRTDIERTMRCGFSRYSCGADVWLVPEPEEGLDTPSYAFGFDSTGTLIANVSWAGLLRRSLPTGKDTDCFCDGSSSLTLPNLRECKVVKVPCAPGQQPGARNVGRVGQAKVAK